MIVVSLLRKAKRNHVQRQVGCPYFENNPGILSGPDPENTLAVGNQTFSQGVELFSALGLK